MTSTDASALVEQVAVDGLRMWRVTVTKWEHFPLISKCLARVAWCASWDKAMWLADHITRVPSHPALGGIQWCGLAERPSPRQVAERLAVVGRREPIPRIGLAAAMTEVAPPALEVCS